jgi:outer membrane protein assembly factor BamB
MPRFASLLTCFGLALVVTSHVARADNWERFRGPNGTGISNDKNILTEFSATTGVLWKAPSGEGNASPIVWGNRLFLHTTSIDGKQRSLICLDTADGKEVWKKTIKAIKPNQIVRKDSSYASSTPTTDGQMVYVSFWDGKDVILAAYSFKKET